MGKALTSPVKFDPQGHDGYVGSYPTWPRHGVSRGIWIFSPGRQDAGWHWADRSLMARERAKLLLPDESVASLGPFLSRPCPTRRADMGVPEL